MFKRICLITATTLVFTTCAQAQTPFYITATVGGVFPSGNSSFTEDSSSVLYSPTAPGISLFSLPNVTWKNSYNNGFNFSLATGYQFASNWRSDVEFLYQQMQRQIKGSYDWEEINSATGSIYATSLNNPITSKSANTNVYSFLTNIYYDFEVNTQWTTSLGAGVGVSWVTSPKTTGNNTLVVDDPLTPLFETAPVSQISPALSGTAFTWQLKAAASYATSDKKSVFIQYRLFGTSQIQARQSSITSNPGTTGESLFTIGQHNVSGLLTNIVEVGVRFNM